MNIPNNTAGNRAASNMGRGSSGTTDRAPNNTRPGNGCTGNFDYGRKGSPASGNKMIPTGRSSKTAPSVATPARGVEPMGNSSLPMPMRAAR